MTCDGEEGVDEFRWSDVGKERDVEERLEDDEMLWRREEGEVSFSPSFLPSFSACLRREHIPLMDVRADAISSDRFFLFDMVKRREEGKGRGGRKEGESLALVGSRARREIKRGASVRLFIFRISRLKVQTLSEGRGMSKLAGRKVDTRSSSSGGKRMRRRRRPRRARSPLSPCSIFSHLNSILTRRKRIR